MTISTIILSLLLLPFSLSLSCPPPHFPFFPPFQLHCSKQRNPLSLTLTIHNLTFSLLNFTSPTSLLIKPTSSSLSQISFSNSPFYLSHSSCLALSLLKPSCHLLNCSLDCHFVTNPSRILPDCHPTPQLHHSGCEHDVLTSLEEFLALGIEIEWDPQDCRGCKTNKTKCGFSTETLLVCPTTSDNRAVVRLVFILFVCIVGILLIGALILRSRRRRVGVLGGEDPAVLYLHRHRSASLLPPVFTYEELEFATNRFDLRRKIGDGGFGSVFLGQLYDGRIVAVKRLHRGANIGKSLLTKSFCNEILILSSIDHPNLVRLHGYCSDTRGLILVYDYVSNGTVFEHLHNRAYRKGAMTWQVRVEIALQIALAIEYLHFSVLPPIVHRDITSSNIFVEKDMRIKVGDFGLSRLLVFSEKTTGMGSDMCVWTGPQGTPGYLDPDYHRSFRLTEKSDVYSFGVVLLELVTGMKAVDQRREKGEVALAEMVVGRIQMGLLNQVVDPALVAEGGGGEAVERVGAVAELAFRCVAVDKDDRPDAREVVAELRRICNRRGGGRGSNSMNVVVPNDGV